MAASGAAVRLLGVLAVAYALFLAWAPIQFVLAAPTAGEATAAVAGTDRAARAALAKEGRTPEDVAGAFAEGYRREVLAAVAPELALDALAAIAGILLVFHRRLGAWLLLVFLAWPAAVAGYRWVHERFFAVHLEGLRKLPVPMTARMVHFDALGHSFEWEAGAFELAVRLAFTALALAILVGWRRAARRPRGLELPG